MKKSSVWLPVAITLAYLGYSVANAIRSGFTHPLDYALAASAIIILALLIWNSALAIKRERLQHEHDEKTI